MAAQDYIGSGNRNVLGGKNVKILLITVAGLSTRFSESLGKPCIKCIYYKNTFEESLLYRMLHHSVTFDKYVIVGGYKFDELQKAIKENFFELNNKIILLKNDRYAEFGSGYSLYLGLKAAADFNYDELIFAEGDLFVDDASFARVYETQNNVITCNREPILANKAVAFYFDVAGRIHYLYDTEHSKFEVKKPFQGIFNSGQIWKFCSKETVSKTMKRVSAEEWEETNLAFIQRYFGNLPPIEYEIIMLEKWINCNTVNDFNKIV